MTRNRIDPLAAVPDAVTGAVGPTELPEQSVASEPFERTEHSGKTLWQHLGFTVSAALFLLVIALAAIVIVIPKVAGGMPLTVLTSSMNPSLPAGTLIIVRPVDPDDLRIGDVVTYQIRSGEPGVITHRIVSVTSTDNGDRIFELKGDNNSVADEDPVQSGQVQGKLWYSVPLLGYVNNAINREKTPWLIPASAAALFLYSGVMVAGGVRAGVKKRRAPEDGAA